jgi:hypothetical protein
MAPNFVYKFKYHVATNYLEVLVTASIDDHIWCVVGRNKHQQIDSRPIHKIGHAVRPSDQRTMFISSTSCQLPNFNDESNACSRRK